MAPRSLQTNPSGHWAWEKFLAPCGWPPAVLPRPGPELLPAEALLSADPSWRHELLHLSGKP